MFLEIHFHVALLYTFICLAVTLKTGRREVPGSNPSRVCRPNRSEFFVVFSEIRVNMR